MAPRLSLACLHFAALLFGPPAGGDWVLVLEGRPL